MGTVTTTTVGTPLAFPSETYIERGIDNRVYAIVAATTANTYELWRSVDGGANWAVAASLVRANVQEVASIQVLRSPYNQLVWAYRVYEGGVDKVFIRTISDLGGSGSLTWNPEQLAAAVTAASAGAILTGIDVANVTVPGAVHYVILAIGIQQGTVQGAHLNIMVGSTLANAVQNNNVISGTRIWVPTTGTGRVTPSVDIEHNGDGHTSSAPHLWLGWGRTDAYVVRLAWNGSGWNGPSDAVKLNPVTLTPAQSQVTSRWDGNRFLMCVPDPVSTSVVTVFERNRSNSTTTIRQSPTHPTGVVRNCTLSYNSVSGDFRVYAVGTSTTVLYYVDYVRATGLWTSWASVLATAVLGATGQNFSVRRGTGGTARYDVLTAHATPTPNTLVSTHQSLSYTPNAPTWDYTAMDLMSGWAADVSYPRVLDWVFSDPDPADTQGSYAVSRQIGAGALAYWRASDSTWQPAEVQNASATSAITMPLAWQPASDAATTFRAKVWDAAGIPSVYGDALIVVPSTQVLPVITSPTVMQTITADTVPVTWTAGEQSAYRVRLHRMFLSDGFGRTVAPGGWGNADYSGATATSGGAGADYSVSGGVGRISMATIANREVIYTPPALSADFDVIIGPITIAATATGAPIEGGFRGRYVDANNSITFRYFWTTANTLTLNIVSRIGGVDTATGFPVALGITSASSVMIHARAEGQHLMMRAWPITAAEPTFWHAELFNASQLATGVAYRYFAGPNGGNTNTLPLLTTVDNISVRAIDATYDSGWQTSDTVRSVTPPTRLADLTAWMVGVSTKNVEGLSATEQAQAFTVDYIEPAVPTLVAVPIPGLGVIRVTVTNPAPSGGQPEVASQTLYQRVAGGGTSGVPLNTALASGAVYDDFSAVSGVVYEYRVLTLGANGTSVYSAWTA